MFQNYIYFLHTLCNWVWNKVLSFLRISDDAFELRTTPVCSKQAHSGSQTELVIIYSQLLIQWK